MHTTQRCERVESFLCSIARAVGPIEKQKRRWSKVADEREVGRAGPFWYHLDKSMKFMNLTVVLICVLELGCLGVVGE